MRQHMMLLKFHPFTFTHEEDDQKQQPLTNGGEDVTVS